MITPDAKIVTVNKSFTDLWGYTPEQVYGKSVLKMFPKEETPKQLDEMKKAVKTETIREFETVALTKNGKIIPINLSGSIIKDENFFDIPHTVTKKLYWALLNNVCRPLRYERD